MDRAQAEEANRRRKAKAEATVIALIVGSIAGYFVCVSIGSVRLPVSDVFQSLFGSGVGWGTDTIVRDIRAPRVLGAALAGASLAVGGMAMQALFRNPMASPSVLGVSSGASFGAAFYIAVGSTVVISGFGTMLSAFVMAMITLILAYGLAYRRNGGVQTTLLLLAGMAVSAMFSGLTSMIEFFSDADTVTSIVFWMLGSFDGCGWNDDLVMLICLIVGGSLILVNVRELNIITAGESKARALGVNVRRVRLMLLFGSALLVAGTVSVCGVIGFVGLIIPHAFRTLTGPDHVRLAPACLFGGAIFLMLVDTFARSAMPPYELPVGTVTSVIGAPFFLWILRSRSHDLWRN